MSLKPLRIVLSFHIAAVCLTTAAMAAPRIDPVERCRTTVDPIEQRQCADYDEALAIQKNKKPSQEINGLKTGDLVRFSNDRWGGFMVHEARYRFFQGTTCKVGDAPYEVIGFSQNGERALLKKLPDGRPTQLGGWYCTDATTFFLEIERILNERI